jgi:hypothetical protein
MPGRSDVEKEAPSAVGVKLDRIRLASHMTRSLTLIPTLHIPQLPAVIISDAISAAWAATN